MLSEDANTTLLLLLRCCCAVDRPVLASVPRIGTIDRKEFRHAIKTLGFGALADNEDIDMVFDEFDESKDGLIQCACTP